MGSLAGGSGTMPEKLFDPYVYDEFAQKSFFRTHFFILQNFAKSKKTGNFYLEFKLKLSNDKN